MSRPKYTSTATSVPSWDTAVNDAPASAEKNTRDTIARWLDDEIGRNSVRPWTIDRTTTCNHDIGSTPPTVLDRPGSSARWAGHRLGGRHGVAHGSGQAALVVDIEVGEAAGRGRYHVLFVRHRAGEAGVVDLDQELTAVDLEGKAAAIAEVTESAGEYASGNVLDSKLAPVGLGSHGQRHQNTITRVTGREKTKTSICLHRARLDFLIDRGRLDRLILNTSEGYPLTMLVNRAGLRRSTVVLLAFAVVAAGCSSNPLTAPPPTIEPAAPAVSPPPATQPAGELLPLGGRPEAAIFDERTGSLAVLAPGADPQSPSTLTLFAVSGGTRELTLPGPATALAGDDQGSAYLSTRGGYFTVDLAAGAATPVSINDETDTDFTAIARRADGRLVLGSADGTAYTLGSETAVAEKVKIFARVDAIVTEGNNAVVLDRGQTSVTSLDSDGHTQQALRAGEGATSWRPTRWAGCW